MLFYIGMYRVRSSSNYTLAAKKIFKYTFKGALFGHSSYTAKCYKETCRNMSSLYGTPCMVSTCVVQLYHASEWLCLQL